MLDSLKKFVSQKFLSHDPAGDASVVIDHDVAWSEEILGFTFTKYDPDSLKGRRGKKVYENMMLDEQVKAVVRFKRDAITSRDFDFQFDDDVDLTEDEREFRIGLSSHIIEKMIGSFLDTLHGILSAMYQGYSITEKIHTIVEFKGKSYVGLAALKIKPHETFEFSTDEFGNITRLIQRIAGQDQELDIHKFIHFVMNPETDTHYGRSELREAYRSWFNKDTIIKFWSIFLERSAVGFFWVQAKKGKVLRSGTPEYSSIQDVLTNIQSSTAMILPEGIELNHEKLDSTAAGDTFEKALVYHDLAIAKSLLVPNLLGISQTGQTGAFAQSQTQFKAFFWTVNADTRRLEAVLNEQLFRELGSLNFADGVFPKFKFKPISMEETFALLTAWRELVDVNAVDTSDTDEEFVRSLLGFPVKVDAEDLDDSSTSVNADTALNGGQVTAMLDIVNKVANGDLTKKTGVEVLLRSFPISRDQAEGILADVEEGSIEKQAPPSMIPGQAPVIPEEDEGPGETVIGEEIRTVTGAAFDRAKRRVKFTVINRQSNVVIDKNITALDDAMADAMAIMFLRIEENKLGTPAGDIEEIKSLKFKSASITKINKVIRGVLNDGWDLGTKHSEDELNASRRKFTKINFVRLEERAGEFFATKSFEIAGKLTTDFIAIIKSILFNGIKFSWTTRDIEKKIYESLTKKGLLKIDTSANALGITRSAMAEALEESGLIAARLSTIVKTNVFEALNEARYNFFTDPSLDGFVEALEYSAILDARTTAICSHLDGRVFSVDSDVWTTNGYRPPNHFNCRSLLIAVTVEDTGIVARDASTRGGNRSKKPTIFPQEGFG